MLLKSNFIQGKKFLIQVNLIHTRLAKTKSNSIQLRNYQKECIESTINGLNSGITRQAISLPVGSGKTVVMAHLIPQIPTFVKGGDKVLVLAHRQELLFQAFRTIKIFNPKLRIDIERGRHHCDIDNTDVILVSVQSLGYNNSKRLARFHKEKFKCVIIDEAHHSSATTYLRILNHFGLIKNEEEDNLNNNSNKINNNILLWGCSATLRRHDGIGLSKIFDKIIYHKDFFEMVKEGWLCDIKATTIKTEIDLSNVGYVLGDYNQTQLATAIDTEERNNLIVHGYRRLAKTRKSTIIFALNIQHAINLEKKFKFWKIECEVISSQTRLELRQEYIESFKIGKLKVLINCTILTEGLDIPNIDCIIMARPTKSKPLYQQMLGRGMRKHIGKKECLILDFVDVQKDKTLCSIPTLLGMDYNLILKEQKISQLIEKREKVKEKEKEEKEKKEEEKKKVVLPSFIKNIQLIHYDNLNHINFIQNQTKRKEDNIGDFDWVMLDENCFVLNLLNGQIRIEKEDIHYIVKYRKKILYNKTFIFYTPRVLPIKSDSLESIILSCETYIRNRHSNSIPFILKKANWKQQPISKLQEKLINKLILRLDEVKRKGVDLEGVKKLTKGKASNLILFIKEGGLNRIFNGQKEREVILDKDDLFYEGLLI